MIETGKPSLDGLEHHGIKGMKWGHKKATSSVASTKPKKMTRKEVRADKKAFYEKKANHLIETAAKNGDKVLIKLNTGTEQHVITGREFVNHLTLGGAMNVKWTDIYAHRTGDGPYEITNERNVYRRPDKK